MECQDIVRNIRHGFATNSSSCHTMVFYDGVLKDRVRGHKYYWDDFILTSEEAKLDYLRATVIENMRRRMGTDATNAMLSLLDIAGGSPESISIDYDSIMYLPMSEWGQELSCEFLLEFEKFLRREDVAILGGNSDGPCRPLPKGMRKMPARYLGRDFSEYRAHKNGNYFVLFSLATGSRLRVYFGEGELSPKYPELVDLLITHCCEAGCPFCYQGSTPDGQEADWYYVTRILKDLPPLTEVTLGGGDPLSHSHLIDILHAGHIRNLVMSMTIRDAGRLFENPDTLDALNLYLSAIGLSVRNAAECAEQLPVLLRALGRRVHVNVHYIPALGDGMHDLTALAACVDQIRKEHERSIGLLLLGFKRTGRGALIELPKQLEPVSGMRLLDLSYDYPELPINVDTVFLGECLGLTQLVDQKYFSLSDGEFSMYVDAVEHKAYRSSYELDASVPLEFDESNDWEARVSSCFAAVRQLKSSGDREERA